MSRYKYINEDELILDDKNFDTYIDKYGEFRIKSYCDFLKKLNNDNKIKTSELVLLIELDNFVSKEILFYSLDFEKCLNNKVIEMIYKINNIPDDYILEITSFDDKNKTFNTFKKEVYDNAKSCNLITDLCTDINLIPLKVLSNSWNFYTLISFIELQDETTKQQMAYLFGFNYDYKSLISIWHTIRKFRNQLSHNNICLNSYIDYYTEPFNHWLNWIYKTQFDISEKITIKKLIMMIGYFLNTNILDEIKKSVSINETLLNKFIK